MNVFYVEPEHVTGSHFELTGQEAQHAAKVLRVREGDEIHATDGQGKRFTGNVEAVHRQSITVTITHTEVKPEPKPQIIMALGVIKKRDRLEFAVEKAVELGASEIALFHSHHSEKTGVKLSRLESIVMSAMKQSLRLWLPKISVSDSLEEVLKKYPQCKIVMAHEKADASSTLKQDVSENTLLLVGPEGGFSEKEVESVIESGGEIVSLGEYRLRAETAVVAILSRIN